MVDIQKQIDYWINGAEDNIITADLLISLKKKSLWIVFLPFSD